MSTSIEDNQTTWWEHTGGRVTQSHVVKIKSWTCHGQSLMNNMCHHDAKELDFHILFKLSALMSLVPDLNESKTSSSQPPDLFPSSERVYFRFCCNAAFFNAWPRPPFSMMPVDSKWTETTFLKPVWNLRQKYKNLCDCAGPRKNAFTPSYTLYKVRIAQESKTAHYRVWDCTEMLRKNHDELLVKFFLRGFDLNVWQVDAFCHIAPVPDACSSTVRLTKGPEKSCT